MLKQRLLPALVVAFLLSVVQVPIAAARGGSDEPPSVEEPVSVEKETIPVVEKLNHAAHCGTLSVVNCDLVPYHEEIVPSPHEIQIVRVPGPKLQSAEIHEVRAPSPHKKPEVPPVRGPDTSTDLHRFDHIEDVLTSDGTGPFLLGREETLIPMEWLEDAKWQDYKLAIKVEITRLETKYRSDFAKSRHLSESYKKELKAKYEKEKKKRTIQLETIVHLKKDADTRLARLEEKSRDVLDVAHIDNREGLARFIEDLKKVAVTEKEQLAKAEKLKVVVAAKKKWLELQEDAGSRVSMRSYSPESNVGLLRSLQEFNSPEIDNLITARIIHDHDERKTLGMANTGKGLDVFIQGGGPSGLYAALKQFQEGADVDLANNRGDMFSRSQIIRFDPKWQAELQYFLGNDYQDILNEERGTIRRERNPKTNVATDMLEIPLYEIEDALYKRAKKVKAGLDAGLSIHKEKATQSRFNLDYDTAVTEVLRPTDENPRYRVKLKDTKVPDGEEREVATDILIFAGGSNNPLRDEMISPGFTRTKPLAHSVSVFLKPTVGKGHDDWTGPGKPLMLKTAPDRVDGAFDGRLHMDELAEQMTVLSKQGGDADLNDWVKKELVKVGVSEEEATAYNLSHKIVESERDFLKGRKADLLKKDPTGKNLDPRDDPDKTGYRPVVTIRQFENDKSVYLGYKVPKAIADLREKVSQLKKAAEKLGAVPKDNIYDQFIGALEVRYHTAAKNALTHDPHLLTRDPRPIANGFFDVAQTTGNKTSTVHHSRQSDLVALAVGDAVASPHFMTWSGLNIARNTVDEAAKHLRQYFDFPTTHEVDREAARKFKLNQEFGMKLQAEQNKSTQFLRYRAELLFLEALSEQEQRQLAAEKQKEILYRMASRHPDPAVHAPLPGEIQVVRLNQDGEIVAVPVDKKGKPLPFDSEREKAEGIVSYQARISERPDQPIFFTLGSLSGSPIDHGQMQEHAYGDSYNGTLKFDSGYQREHRLPGLPFFNLADLVEADLGADHVVAHSPQGSYTMKVLNHKGRNSPSHPSSRHLLRDARDVEGEPIQLQLPASRLVEPVH